MSSMFRFIKYHSPKNKKMKALALKLFNIPGMKWGLPFVKLFSGEEVTDQLKAIGKNIIVPVASIVLFLLIWSFGASKIQTSLGQVPGPAMVWIQAKGLWKEHVAEREKARQFKVQQENLK